MPASIGLIRTDEKGGRGRGCGGRFLASGVQRLRLVEPDDPWRRCSFEAHGAVPASRCGPPLPGERSSPLGCAGYRRRSAQSHGMQHRFVGVG
jgi:hypothetical protein